jgi:tape measure domain-containing protein
MATNDRNIGLRISARAEGLNDLQRVSEVLDRLEKSQQDFARSAGTAGRSLRNLEGELRDLNRVAGSLNKLSELNDSLNDQRQVARDSVAQLRKAREELAKYVAANDKGTVGVRKYNRQVKALQRQVDAADKAQASARKTAQQYSAQLRQLGLNSAEARDNLRALGAATERQLAAAQQNIRTFDQRVDRERQIAAEVQRRAAVEAQAAAAAKQADQERNRALEERKRRLEQATAVLRAESDRQLAAIRREATARRDAERKVTTGFTSFSRAAGGAPARARQADADAAATAARAQREREITAEVQRRAAIEQQAAAQRKREEEERNRLIRERQARLDQAVGVLRPTLDRQIGQESRTNQVAAARAQREEQRKLADTTNKTAQAQGGLAEALRKVAGQGRTTLDFYQRLRGQLLELVATYGSFFAAISTAQQAITVSLERTSIQNRLLFANNNDVKRTGEDLEFVRGVADRLGQSYNQLATLYSRFAAASAAANQPIERTRRIFEQLTEAFTVLGLSQADVEGSFRALEQSISKGSVQAEELRGQLGDRFPGAVARFASSIGVTVEELNKLLEAGRVSSAAIEFFAEDIAAAAKDTLPNATNSLRASLNRLRTAYEDFLVTIVDSGFGDQLALLSRQLAEFFQSAQGVAFARGISDAFSLVTTAAQFLIQNIDALLIAVRLLIGSLIGRGLAAAALALLPIFTALRGAFLGTAAAATTAATATTGAAVAARGFAAALGPLALILGVASTVLFEWFIRARDAERKTRELKEETLRLQQARGDELRSLRDLNQSQLDDIKNRREQIKTLIAEKEARLEIVRATARQSLAEQLRNNPGAVARFGNTSREGIAAQQEEIRLQRELAELSEKDAADASEQAVREQNARIAAQRDLNGANAKRIEAIERTRSLEAEINDKANAEQLRKNDDFYNKFTERVAAARKALAEATAVDGVVSPAEQQRLQSIIDAADGLRLQSRGVIRPGGAADDKSAERAVEQRNREIERLEEASQQERERSLRDSLQRLTDDEATAAEARVELIKLEYQQKIAEQRKFQQEATALGQTSLAAQFGANISALEGEQEQVIALEQRKTAIDNTRSAYEKLDQALQNTIAKRDAELERINLERELGLITQQQAEQAADRITAEYQPQILSNLQALRDFIEANADALGKMFNVEEILLQLDSLQLKTETVVTAGQRRAQELKESFAQGAAQALSSLGTGIADAIRGFSSFGDAIKGARDAFLNFAADFLIQIGQMILQQAILNALQNSGNGFFQSIGNILAGTAHTGAIVGKGFPEYRRVNPAIFANAPRYHSGGIVGLKPDEVPAILQTGEEVLARNDPRNVMNGGASGGSNVQIVNAIDAESVVAAGMQGNAGRQVIMNIIQANKAAFRQVLAS